MSEFLTWNKLIEYSANYPDYALLIRLILPFVVAMVAIFVTWFLDRFGAPDDDVSFDPRYDKL